MRHSKIRFTGMLVVLSLVLAACVTGGSIGNTTTTSSVPDRVGRQGPGGFGLSRNALVRFDACDAFLEYVTSHAVDLVGPYGLSDGYSYPLLGFGGERVFEAATAEDSATEGGSASYSGTNVQVLGVDEPDMVKTDGERIVVLSEGVLIVADVSGDEPRVLSRLQVGDLAVQNLFLSGDTVLMFGSAWNWGPTPLIEGDAEFAPSYQTPTLQIIEVDISGDAEIIRKMTIDGSFLSARMVDDSVRLVLSSGPVGFEWSYPSGSGLRAERKAIEENKQIILDSTEENWIPYYIVTNADGDVTSEGSLFDCDRASHPDEFSGLNMLTVITIDIVDGLDVVDSTGVLANGDTIYASSDNLYVATQNWRTWQFARLGAEENEIDSVSTDIHKFDITDPRETTYVATGRVQGYLLNQFAMDEHNGYLRVASTSQPAWWGGDQSDSQSMVTVLSEDGAELTEVGFVDGLGKTEQIYSVRFLEDVAYVVTFRQTDPLYTIDLSDPRKPEVVGELKILGYSAYLHPLGDGLLMGVGQDANDEGRVEGSQVSIFDVSDPANPRKIDQVTLSKGSNSSVEYDHHAFLYWGDTGLAMIPIQQWWWDSEKESVFFGAIALNVGEDGDLSEIARITHPGGERDEWDWRAQITRSIVIDDYVYTISAKGILKSDLDSLEESDWLSF